ncbi:major facilitator transporter [Arthrobacter crystallopoietes BAB-32]|uniref:Major facilitator transporter n=1 Tax=Arthrobacter crystallopoietes BAB-32 TaxID=1246476 RepID=N1V6R0_9MICC|nr:MFS transporter [Arthrobacter crystallopoietes]EMY33938.1 major facilitator transporter [Arthrobacter crystallopoietes BAB-32]
MQEPGGTAGAQVPASVFAEPTRRVGAGWITGVILVNVGINAAFFGPLQVLLAQQAQAFDAANKEAVLALATGFGAAVSLVANPIAGAFSDRTTSALGRRVPWVLGGAVLAFAALLLLAGAPSIAVMVVGWCLVQAGCNGAYAAVTASIPDRVPTLQRGQVGGLAAMGQTVGIVFGAVLANLAGGFVLGYIYCAVFLLASVMLFLVKGRDVPLDPALRPPFAWGRFLKGFYISPRRYPDFGWAWLTRFLVNLGNSLFTLYLFFFLQDAVGHPDPAAGVLLLTGIYALMVVITAVVGGPWSDRIERRKPFVIASAVTIATASLLMAFWQTWPVALVAAAVLGAGFGMFLAVDFALLTQVLPSAADRGKDLGVINIANSSPQVVAPLIAAPVVLYLGGYTALFMLSAVIGLLGAVFVVKIKQVR